MTKYSRVLIEDAVANSLSYAGVLRDLGIGQAGGSQCHMKRRIEAEGIDASHFTGQGHNRGKSWIRRSADSILIKRTDGRRQHHKYLKRSLVEKGILYKCVGCDNDGEWKDMPITLQVDHINGDWLDDRIENLQFLCPNCHSVKPR